MSAKLSLAVIKDRRAGKRSASRLSHHSWAEAMAAWSQQGREVFCNFDNDEAGYAARNDFKVQALIRKKMIGVRTPFLLGIEGEEWTDPCIDIKKL